MRKIIVILFVALFGCHFAQGQDIIQALKHAVPGQGRVAIYQGSRWEKLIGVNIQNVSESGQVLKIPGFRVQIYAGKNSRESRAEATALGNKVKELFPESPVYTLFISPRWLCKVGDFRSIEEADVMMRQLQETGEFKELTIVKEQINIPL